MKRSKNYRKIAELVDPERLYGPAEAFTLAKKTVATKFDPTVEVVAAARRRPAQGRPDGPRHGQPAARHRQDRPRPRLRRWATAPRRRGPPAPTSSVGTS